MNKSTLFTVALLLLCILGFSQIPQGFNYQAVLRDSDGKVKANANVSIEISLIQESIDGEAIYTEVHNTATNKFGLVNLVIGQGETTDDLSTINWAEDLFFIKITVDGTVMGTNQLLSVPFAMHAQTAGNTFSGNYNDLENQPDLSGYLTEETDGSITNELQVLTISNDTIFLSDGGFVKLPAGTSFSGSFNDLTDVPTGLSDGDDDTQLDETAVDAFVANNGYLTAEVDGSVTNEIQAISISNDTIYLSGGGFVKLPASVSFSGSFNDLTDVPVNLDTDSTDDFDGDFTNLTNVPTGLTDGDDDTQLDETAVDAFVANNGYLTAEVDGSVTNEIQAISISNDTIYLSGGGFVKLPASVSFSGSFNDLADIPVNLDTDSTDDFDGDFTNLTNVPTGLADGDDDTQLDETAVDAFVANNGYLTTEVDGSITNEIELPTQTGNSGKVLSTDGSSPSWVADDVLTESEVDTYVSNNGYLTTEVDGSVTNEIELPTQTGNSGKMLTTDGSSPSWAAVSYNDLTDVPANIDTDATDDFDGAYSSLSGAPTNVSTFTNDAGYLTTEVDGSITNEIELPTQTGNSGKVLSTDGSSPSWVADDVLTESEVDTYVSNNGYLTTEVDGSVTNEIELPTQTGNSGKMLTTDGSSPSWAAVSYNDLTDVPANIDTDATDDFDGAYSSLSGAPTNVSTFTNDAGYLTTEVDGSVTNEIELPTQTGHSGKYLTTDGSSVSWATVSAGSSFSSITVNSGGSSSSNAILNYGRLLMLNTDNSAAQLRFQEPSGSGTSYISLESPAVSGNYQIKLPAADGTNGQVLKTDGSGQWGWTSVASKTVTTITSNTTLSTADQTVFINGAYTATLPSTPADGQKIIVCATNSSAGIDSNGKNMYAFNSTYTTMPFSTWGHEMLTLVYSSSIGVWFLTY